MIKACKRAYGAGYRAGKAKAYIQYKSGVRGIKVIIMPTCPYKGATQYIFRICWFEGWYNGIVNKLGGF